MTPTTVLLAKMAAAYFIVTGIGLLVSTDFYARMVRDNRNTDPVTLNLSGAVHFLVGMAILVRHMRFGSLPEVVVTLIGFAATLKGCALIVIPELTLKAPQTGRSSLRITGAVFALIGIYLGWVGFF